MSTTSSDTLLTCEDLVVGFRGRGILPPIDLSVRRGEFLLVAGRNGSGKTTWLRTVLGAVPPVRGRVHRPARPRLAYVPQSAQLDEILPVRGRDVVDWGRIRGWSFLRPFASRADREVRNDALAQAEAVAFAARRYGDLSGGQRQRVLFARMLASDAELVLLDEPTASMDTASERDAYERLSWLARQRGAAIIVVTHTLAIAAQYADEILFLDPGDRKDQGVAEVGAPKAVSAHPTFKRHFGELDVAFAAR